MHAHRAHRNRSFFSTTMQTPTPDNPLAPLMEQLQEPPRGVIHNMPASVYHGRPELSKSRLDIFHACPLDYADSVAGKFRTETTPAMVFGTLAHAVILEGRTPYYIRPDFYESKEGKKPWNANATACKEWLAAYSDMPVISAAEHDYLQRCRELVERDSRCRELLASAVGFELSVFANHDDIDEGIKARLDGLSHRVFDLKTCSDASTQACSRTLALHRYHVQAAWYLDILESCGVKAEGFSFIFLQKSEQPRLNVRHLKRSAIALGRDEYQADIKRLMECRCSGDWPGYSGGADDGIQELDLPQWCYSAAIVGDDIDVAFPDGKAVTL